MTPPVVLAAGLGLALCACTPALDWREVRPAGSGASVLLPCRPNGQERRVPLAGQAVQLTLYACSANGQTWGLAFADVADPARLGAALEALRGAAAANIRAVAPGQALALAVPGATPHAAAVRTRLAGLLPTGEAVQMQVAVFARGTRVFQATVLGAAVADELAETYFSSIRFV